MYSASSNPQAAAEKIYKLFGKRFLHIRDATMAVTSTASPTLDPSVTIRA